VSNYIPLRALPVSTSNGPAMLGVLSFASELPFACQRSLPTGPGPAGSSLSPPSGFFPSSSPLCRSGNPVVSFEFLSNWNSNNGLPSSPV
jgi:hypothetical protein